MVRKINVAIDESILTGEKGAVIRERFMSEDVGIFTAVSSEFPEDHKHLEYIKTSRMILPNLLDELAERDFSVAYTQEPYLNRWWVECIGHVPKTIQAIKAMPLLLGRFLGDEPMEVTAQIDGKWTIRSLDGLNEMLELRYGSGKISVCDVEWFPKTGSSPRTTRALQFADDIAHKLKQEARRKV